MLMRCAKVAHSIFCNWAAEYSILFEEALLCQAQHQVMLGLTSAIFADP